MPIATPSVLNAPMAVALLLAFGCGDGDSAAPTSELESKIEALRRGASRHPDSLDALQTRLDTLWEWANDRAIAGRTLPRDLGRLVRTHALALDRQRSAPDPETEVLESTRSFIERYADELATVDDDPDAILLFGLEPSGPFRAGERIALDQTLVIGGLAIAEGGGVILPIADAVPLQATDPSTPNYVSVRASNPKSKLEPAVAWGDWEKDLGRPTLSWRLSGAPLASGDSVTLSYATLKRDPPGSNCQTPPETS